MADQRVKTLANATEELVTEVKLLQERLATINPRVDGAYARALPSRGGGRAERAYAGKTNGFTTLCRPFFDSLSAETGSSSGASVNVVACGVNDPLNIGSMYRLLGNFGTLETGLLHVQVAGDRARAKCQQASGANNAATENDEAGLSFWEKKQIMGRVRDTF